MLQRPVGRGLGCAHEQQQRRQERRELYSRVQEYHFRYRPRPPSGVRNPHLWGTTRLSSQLPPPCSLHSHVPPAGGSHVHVHARATAKPTRRHTATAKPTPTPRKACCPAPAWGLRPASARCDPAVRVFFSKGAEVIKRHTAGSLTIPRTGINRV